MRRRSARSSTSSAPIRAPALRAAAATVRIRLFQAFLDAAVSEQISRMVAMKAATEAAEETIKTLTRQYNRAAPDAHHDGAARHRRRRQCTRLNEVPR